MTAILIIAIVLSAALVVMFVGFAMLGADDEEKLGAFIMSVVLTYIIVALSMALGSP
jgi:hypothetical protein